MTQNTHDWSLKTIEKFLEKHFHSPSRWGEIIVARGIFVVFILPLKISEFLGSIVWTVSKMSKSQVQDWYFVNVMNTH